MKIRSIVFCLFLVGGLFASVSSREFQMSNLPSLSWQVKQLESNLKALVERNLSTVIRSGNYVVNIDVATSIPETPDFYSSDHEFDPFTGESLVDSELDPLDALDTEDAEEEMLMDEEAREELESMANIRFEDVLPTERSDRFIVFSKLGMVAPLVDDFNDLRPDGRILLKMEGMDDVQASRQENERNELVEQARQREQELKTQIEEMKAQSREPSMFEQMWKYNSSLDIFSNLRSVTVSITLDEGLHQSTRDVVERVINGINFNLGNITPTIEIQYLPMNEVTVDERTFQEKLLEFLETYSLLVAIVLAAMILAIAAYMIFRQYAKMNKGDGDSATSMAGDLNNKFEDQEKEEDESGSGAGGSGQEKGSNLGQEFDGIDRFRTFFQKSQYDACLLIKRWLKAKGEKENDALRALVQQLDNDILIDIFKVLSEEEREEWKFLLDKSLNYEALVRANQFMSNQIVEEIILPSVINDKEACDYLLKIKPKRAAELVQSHPKMGRILLNVMNARFVNQVMEQVSSENVDTLIELSLDFNASEVQGELEEFKKTLAQYVDDVSKVPFAAKLKELIPTASPSKEFSMYKGFARFGTADEVKVVASSHFPSFLITKLPEKFLKSCLSSYPLSQRVEFLLSQSEEDRDYYISISAPEGTKARDLLDIEFESAADNLVIQKRIKENRDEIMANFRGHIRASIRSEKSIVPQIEGIIEGWYETLPSTSHSSDNVVNLLKTGT